MKSAWNGESLLERMLLLASQRMPKRKVVNERRPKQFKQNQRPEKEVKQRVPSN
jgi:hypothetical protein